MNLAIKMKQKKLKRENKMIKISFSIKFHKMHSLGNDFVIILEDENKDFDIDLDLNANLVQKMSDRKYGIGCDQFIIVQKTQDNIHEMIVYNTDGSLSGMCGNATRCLAGLLSKEGDEIQIKSGDKILKCRHLVNIVEVNIGTIVKIKEFNDIEAKKLISNDDSMQLISINSKFVEFKIHNMRAFYLNIGNPHLVILMNDATGLIDKEVFGKYLHALPCFTEKTNVNFAYIASFESIKLKTYERGVGLTNACGSGACASVFILNKHRLVSNNVSVAFESGDLNININNKLDIIMIGDYNYIFNGRYLFK